MAKVKDNGTMLKEARGKSARTTAILYGCQLTSQKQHYSQKEVAGHFKYERKNPQARMVGPARSSLSTEGEIKSFPHKQS